MNGGEIMKRIIVLFFSAAILFSFLPSGVNAQDEIYYARCNLKVIKGSYITWVNWQATRTFIPVGTKLKVRFAGSKATLIDVKTGKSYTLDIGASGEIYLKKFVIKKPVNISRFPKDIQAQIHTGFAKVGMTKEQAYIAMGPPAWADGKTYNMTYADIMSKNLWVYKRRRFGKNIGIEFDPSTGRVIRTEGLWGH